MTNQIGNPMTQAAKRMPGLEQSSVLFDDTPYWHTVAWEIIVLVGSCVLLVCILRGLFNLKDNRIIAHCRKTIAVTTAIIISSATIELFFDIADRIESLTSSHFTGLRESVVREFAWDVKLFAASIGIATVGLIAFMVLPNRVQRVQRDRS